MSRFVLDSNNLWLVAFSDNTIRIFESPVDLPDLNTHNVPYNFTHWKEAARIGTISGSTHRELEVFGVVLGAQKLAELNKIIADHQAPVNREGFMFSWFNVRSTDRNQTVNTVMRRLNDLFDWAKYGVEVPLPVQTDWDRFQVDTGKLMVPSSGQLKKEMEEKEEENQRLKKQVKEKDENDKEIEELKKQVQEKDENDKEMEELKKQVQEKDDQLAARDKKIAALKKALRELL